MQVMELCISHTTAKIKNNLFGIGVILPTFHADGTVPVEIDKLNKLLSRRAVLDETREAHFSIILAIPSVPVDLDASSCVSMA